MSIKGLLIRIINALNRLPKYRVIANGVGYKATSTNWEYTGTSFTVPSGHAYLVLCAPSYNTGKPVGCGIETASSIPSGYDAPRYYVGGGSTFSGRGSFFLLSGTYYYFEKRAGVPSLANAHYIYAIDYNLGG